MSETKRIMSNGNDAIGHGAIAAGCKFFFGYPITPQNEIPAFFAANLPKAGGTFVQTESEISSIQMLVGAVAAGARAITSTSSPGYSLMQEGMSGAHAIELPCVIVNVQRGGPGSGSIATGQTDYNLATKSAGHGGCPNITLSPSSVQEAHDFVQLAFYLADKYRMVTVVLSDAIVGQGAEAIEVKTLDFGELPEKSWAIKPSGDNNNWPVIMDTYMPFTYGNYFPTMKKKWDKIKENEVRYEEKLMDDAEIMVVAWGSTARTALEAVNWARKEGIKAGLFRPITLWPFPEEQLSAAGKKVKKVLMVEDNQGQMVYDVERVLCGKDKLTFMGIEKRDEPGALGLLYPKPILEELRRMAS
jgi:2-oxoglutarate/2-oxoacid ferredoxin oxidoreductase subunit alpha